MNTTTINDVEERRRALHERFLETKQHRVACQHVVERAAKTSNRALWDKARVDLEWAEAQEREATKAYEVESIKLDEEIRAAKLADLGNERIGADISAARADIDELADDAAAHVKAIAKIRAKARARAAEQRKHASRVRHLAGELAIVTLAPELNDDEADAIIDQAIKETT